MLNQVIDYKALSLLEKVGIVWGEIDYQSHELVKLIFYPSIYRRYSIPML